MPIQPMMLQSSVIRRASYLEMGGLPAGLRTREDTLLFFKLGLLYPACAVLGCGAVMTSDSDMRLTQEIHSSTLRYCLATIAIYREVLALGNMISAERRKVFDHKLSAAYFALGRLFYREKQYLGSIKNLSISGFVSPSMFVKCFLDSASRHMLRGQEECSISSNAAKS
jgi:hypothetical protein